MASRSTEHNRAFYQATYRVRGPVGHLLRATVSFDQQSKARLNQRALAPVLAELAAGGGELRILDYGCGWGSLLLRLRGRSRHLYGHDLIGDAVDNLGRTMRAIGARFSPAEVDGAGQISPSGFDVVVVSHVLEHVEDDAALLRSLVAALVPGGALLVNVPINEVFVDPKHVRAYDERTLRALLAEAGLEIRTLGEFDRWSAWLLATEQRAARPSRWLLRALRGVLAVTPLPINEAVERWLVGDLPRQQLVALAIKPG